MSITFSSSYIAPEKLVPGFALGTCIYCRVETEIKMVNEQTTKHIKAKLAIQELNEFYKKQIIVIKEDGELRLKVFYENPSV
jgi:hypothetical protein